MAPALVSQTSGLQNFGLKETIIKYDRKIQDTDCIFSLAEIWDETASAKEQQT
jgi:hypothetical protein